VATDDKGSWLPLLQLQQLTADFFMASALLVQSEELLKALPLKVS
jgi:hypothetical protein